eukprot:6161608-Pyramimonas_sp.AAC.1
MNTHACTHTYTDGWILPESPRKPVGPNPLPNRSKIGRNHQEPGRACVIHATGVIKPLLRVKTEQ